MSTHIIYATTCFYFHFIRVDYFKDFQPKDSFGEKHGRPGNKLSLIPNKAVLPEAL